MALDFRKWREGNEPAARIAITYTLTKEDLVAAVLLVTLRDLVGIEKVTAERAEELLRNELREVGTGWFAEVFENFGTASEEVPIAEFRAKQLWPDAFQDSADF